MKNDGRHRHRPPAKGYPPLSPPSPPGPLGNQYLEHGKRLLLNLSGKPDRFLVFHQFKPPQGKDFHGPRPVFLMVKKLI